MQKRYYGIFLDAIQSIPWKKLKFADESHFKSKGKIIEFHIVIW